MTADVMMWAIPAVLLGAALIVKFFLFRSRSHFNPPKEAKSN